MIQGPQYCNNNKNYIYLTVKCKKYFTISLYTVYEKFYDHKNAYKFISYAHIVENVL
jgi:hypothetical protein